MARPIEFDPNEVLNRAMVLFWRRGYSRTSMRDIIEATGLQPGSLYAAFANKRALFVRALDFYAQELERFVQAVLGSEEPPLRRIENFFQQLLDSAKADKERKGCLLINTLIETPANDRELLRHAAKSLEKVESAFRQTLEEARAQGQLKKGKNPQAMACLLMAGIYGLRVYQKMSPATESWGQIVDGILSAIR